MLDELWELALLSGVELDCEEAAEFVDIGVNVASYVAKSRGAG